MTQWTLLIITSIEVQGGRLSHVSFIMCITFIHDKCMITVMSPPTSLLGGLECRVRCCVAWPCKVLHFLPATCNHKCDKLPSSEHSAHAVLLAHVHCHRGPREAQPAHFPNRALCTRQREEPWSVSLAIAVARRQSHALVACSCCRPTQLSRPGSSVPVVGFPVPGDACCLQRRCRSPCVGAVSAQTSAVQPSVRGCDRSWSNGRRGSWRQKRMT